MRREISNRMEYNNGAELGSSPKRPEVDDMEAHYINIAPQESHTRSLLKGFTWRILATLTTVTIAWFVTGEVGTAFQIGFVEFFAKIGIYYGHERVWANIQI